MGAEGFNPSAYLRAVEKDSFVPLQSQSSNGIIIYINMQTAKKCVIILRLIIIRYYSTI